MNGVVISYMQILIFVVTFVAMYGLTLFISAPAWAVPAAPAPRT